MVTLFAEGIYLVKGESDAPAAEEQRAPANGWCDLKVISSCFEGEDDEVKCAIRNVQIETSTCGNVGKTVRNLRIEKIGKRLDDWGDHTQGAI